MSIISVDSNVVISMSKAGKYRFASIIGRKSSTIHFKTRELLIVQQLLNIYMIYYLNKSVFEQKSLKTKSHS